LIDNKIIDLYFIDGHLNGNVNFLEDTLGPLLEDLLLIIRWTMWIFSSFFIDCEK